MNRPSTIRPIARLTSRTRWVDPWIIDPYRAPAFSYHDHLRRASNYVRTHLDGDLSLAAVAGAVGIERKYFSTLFRKQAGIGFKSWTRLCRLQRAVELFRTTDIAVTSVAYEVGFHDLRTFERAFRQLLGASPRDFRKGMRPSPLAPAAPRCRTR